MFEEREVVILVVVGGEGEFFFRWRRNLVVIAKAVRAAAERSSKTRLPRKACRRGAVGHHPGVVVHVAPGRAGQRGRR